MDDGACPDAPAPAAPAPAAPAPAAPAPAAPARTAGADLHRLGVLARALLAPAADPGEFVAGTLRRVAELFAADEALLVFADPESELVERRAGQGRAELALGRPLRAAALAAVDSGRASRFSAPAGGEPGERVAGVVVPLPAPNLAIALLRPVPLDEPDLELLALMGRLIALAGGQARHLAQLVRLGEHRMGLASLSDEAEVYRAAVDSLRGLVEADGVGAVVIRGGVATFAAQQGLDPARTARWRCSVRRLPGREALRTGRPFRTGDLREVASQPRLRRGSLRATIGAPVVVEGEPAAMLYAFRRAATPFSDTDAHLVTLLAVQVAATLANRRLLDQAQRRRELAETLRRFAESLAPLQDTGAVLDLCAQTMLSVSGADRVATFLLDAQGRHLVPAACHGSGAAEHLARLERELGRVPVADTSSVAEALRTGTLVIRRFGAKHQPSRAGAKYRLLGPGSWFAAQPLITRGERVGLALLEWLRPNPAPSAEGCGEALARVAGLAAGSLRQVGLLEELRREREQLRALHDVSVSIVESADEQATLQRIIGSVRALTGAEAAWIGLLAEDGEHLNVAAVAGAAAARVGEVRRLADGVAGWSVRHGLPVWVSDRAAGLVDPPQAGAHLRERVPGSGVCMPMFGRGGRALGCLAVHRDQPYALHRGSRDILERLAAEAAVAVENSRHIAVRTQLEDQLRQQAYHDQLTGLPNRALLLDRLRGALACASPQNPVAVLYLDLDRFKTVNDSLGHASGDALLAAVARRLRTVLRPGDLLGRLGGDEFVALLDRLTDADQAQLVARRLIDALSDPILIGPADVHVGVSIGIAVSTGPGPAAEELIGAADIAMYQAKAAGRGDVAVYEPRMGERAGERLSLENDLRRAITGGGLAVHYQPIVDLATGAPVGFEALSRWVHPVRGQVSPDEFIALAEDTGLIEALDASVLAVAAADIRALQLSQDRPELRLNVNLSASRLHRAHLATQISGVLARTGLAPSRLTLEITETAVMHEPQRVLPSLNRLRDLGVRLVMDDFGTGYSNLSYLNRYPLSGLKIDRTFVARLGREPADEAIVAAVSTMSAALGLDVTAEGVETFEQAQLLTRLGCRLAQGYLYSPARPIDELPLLFDELAASSARRKAPLRAAAR